MNIRIAALSLFLVMGAAFTAQAGQPRQRTPRPEISEEMKTKIGERLDQTAGESGLSQKEIDAYIGFIKDVSKAKGNRDKINKAIKKTGMTETRLLYIKMKTDIGCMTASGLPASVFKDAGDHFQPTEDEMKLIKKNLKPLQDASFLAEFPLPE